jgi:hypothetical protein
MSNKVTAATDLPNNRSHSDSPYAASRATLSRGKSVICDLQTIAGVIYYRTYAKAAFACGSMVLYLFCWLFFRPGGAKKQPTKDENPRYA